ncbi:MAG: hypothetical protein IPL08_19970 [Saprospiraceae bacterium]|nr:hypothetical protein [Saprospiraceae bacterium]
MKGKKPISNGFIIDKLTNSIENVVTGDSFATEISILTPSDHKNILKKQGWQFNWKLESNCHERDVINNSSPNPYKLTIVGNPKKTQD